MQTKQLDAIFKAYDVRGLYPQEINEEIVYYIGRAFADFAGASQIIVGRDMRPSGIALTRAFSRGVLEQGVGVIDGGLMSTDTLYYASGVRNLPGAIFTASHNPAAYNGIKLCLAGASPVGSQTGLAEVARRVAAGIYDPPVPETDVEQVDFTADYVKHCLSFIDRSLLRPLKVVADAANGMAGAVLPAVFGQLPGELVPLYFELDGNFPNHPADPINVENLKDLQSTVLSTGADIGLAFDGDADRVFLVDDKAQPVSASLTTAMVAKAVLKKHPGAKVIHNLICSRTVREVIVEEGGEPIRERVGHSFIKATMAKTGAIFGGEHSGHYYFRDNYRADSGLIAALMVLELLSVEGKPLSQVRKPFERYSASGEINSRVGDTQAKLAELKAAYSDGEIDETDGLTVNYPQWWFNVRPSNTEPLLRLNLEAKEPELMTAKRDAILELIRS